MSNEFDEDATFFSDGVIMNSSDNYEDRSIL